MRERGSRPAYRYKLYGIWQSWSWAETAQEIRALALGLTRLGLEPGDALAIIGNNRPQLYWSMVAAQMAGATPVPIYQDSVAEEMCYVLDHAGVTFAVVENQEQVDKLLSIHERLPALRHVVYCDPRGLRNYDHSAMHAFEEVQKIGRGSEAELAPELDRRLEAGKGSDACVILYTSGTTGRPKGVVLTHDNILTTSRASAEFDRLVETDSMLSYLPMAWVGDFIFSMGQAYVKGFCVCCPESPETMLHDLREIGPSYFFAPPSIFERLLTTVMIRIEDASGLKRRMFHAFIAHAKRCEGKRKAGEALSLGDRALNALGELLVYGPLKNVLGFSRVRVGYTAGEAIGPDLFEFYRSIGVNLKQLYGQTEASVFITQQPDDAVDPETVGVPTPGVEIRIDEATGEVFYRSPGVFREYYKAPEETAKTKTEDGWVATGDAGFMDERTGQLRILDRAKDVGRLADGTLFAPKYIENKLKFWPNIREAVCFGHGREYVTAMICMDMESVGNWAERNNIGYGSYQELAAHPQVYEMIQRDVETTNASLAEDPRLAHCQIRRFLILHKELDADDGELTRTMKVRRRIIAERYAPVIDALYSGADRVHCEIDVTYEDGRKGKISGILAIRDAKTHPAAAEPAKAA
ncbi:MAG TPA: AMP-binding protein [Thermohalobaculum sp.]|nr:AMP-binding protein [Thermohalobaculum sp.]